LDGNLCFSSSLLPVLGAIWLVIQGVVIYLFRGWMQSMQAQILEARAQILEAQTQRDRALTGWESALGLGEKAVQREKRVPRGPRMP
jgi:hypothetical protein